ncbi:hypothetical protein ACK331_18125, partial [Aeromonas veronii]
MQNKNVYKISNKFYQVLLKMTGLKISRKELIRLAMEVNDLAVYQASGQGEIVNILLKIKNSFLPTKQILIGL